MKKLTSPLVFLGLLALAISGLTFTLSPAPLAANSAANKVSAYFDTAWNYESLEDTFINSQVTGGKWWQAGMMNSPDETGAPVTALYLNLESAMAFDILKMENLVKSGPPTYEWSFGDVPEQSSAGVWVDSLHDSNPVPVTFTPGFDASRSVDKTEFSETGTQSLTITLTPREVTEGFTVLIQAEENEIVNPVITSPTSGDGIYLTPDGHSLHIDSIGLELNTTWTINIAIQVIPKVPEVTFVPYVLIGQRGMVASGSESGNSFSYPVGDPSDGVGDWTWRAEGLCEWEWNESLSKQVIWAHSYGVVRGNGWGSTPVPVPGGNEVSVGFMEQRHYNVSGDSFMNKEVTVEEWWRTNLINLPDETGASVTGLQLTLDSEVSFEGVEKEFLTIKGPPIYEWSLDDVPNGETIATNGWPWDAYVRRHSTSKLVPGYDVSRSFDKTVFSAQGVQMLTITVTPREESINTVTITVHTDEDAFVDPVVLSYSSTSGGEVKIEQDGHRSEIGFVPVELNTPMTVTVTIQVTPKVPLVHYKPGTGIRAERVSVPDSGITTGNSVSFTTEVGTWTWSAEGDYVWDWGIRCAPGVNVSFGRGSSFPIFIWILVVVILGAIILYRRRRKRVSA